jgi:hypothetical protein
VSLNIRVEEKKTMARNRTRRISGILTINEVEVRSIKYQWTVISNTNDGTEEIKAIILAQMTEQMIRTFQR